MRTVLGGAGICVVLLVLAYLAGRRSGTKTPVDSVAEQFDVVKELNAHAGRLTTMFAVVVATTAFSLANGPIHDALGSFNLSLHAHVYAMLGLLGIMLWFGFNELLGAMNPALPLSIHNEQQWKHLITNKPEQSTRVAIALSVSVAALFLTWVFSYLPLVATGTPLVFFFLLAVGVTLFFLLAYNPFGSRRLLGGSVWWLPEKTTRPRPRR